MTKKDPALTAPGFSFHRNLFLVKLPFANSEGIVEKKFLKQVLSGKRNSCLSQSIVTGGGFKKWENHPVFQGIEPSSFPSELHKAEFPRKFFQAFLQIWPI
ncbi:MAG: hypothetical protein IIZ34_05135, partial [Eubacterium sp.]|nr:hypothetical protein [Eubacterium sp.]